MIKILVVDAAEGIARLLTAIFERRRAPCTGSSRPGLCFRYTRGLAIEHR